MFNATGSSFKPCDQGDQSYKHLWGEILVTLIASITGLKWNTVYPLCSKLSQLPYLKNFIVYIVEWLQVSHNVRVSSTATIAVCWQSRWFSWNVFWVCNKSVILHYIWNYSNKVYYQFSLCIARTIDYSTELCAYRAAGKLQTLSEINWFATQLISDKICSLPLYHTHKKYSAALIFTSWSSWF